MADPGEELAALAAELGDAMGAAFGTWARNLERLMTDAGLIAPSTGPRSAGLFQQLPAWDGSGTSQREDLAADTEDEPDSVDFWRDRARVQTKEVRRLRAVNAGLTNSTSHLQHRLEVARSTAAKASLETARMRGEVTDHSRERFKAALDARQKGERITLLESQLAELRQERLSDERFDNEAGYRRELRRSREFYEEQARDWKVRIDSAEQRLRVADQRIAALEQEAMGKDREIAELQEHSQPVWWPHYRSEFVKAVNRIAGADLPDSATPAELVQHLNATMDSDTREKLIVDEHNATEALAEMTRSRDGWAAKCQQLRADRASDAIADLQKVVMRQIEFTQEAGSAAMRAVDIRRRQLNRWTPEHDWTHHGPHMFVSAIKALLDSDDERWPFGSGSWIEIEETGTLWLHIAALAMAAHDAKAWADQNSEVPF